MRIELVLAAALLAPAQAGRAAAASQASQPAGAAIAEARLHAQKAKIHFDLGEYLQAANEYTLTYRLVPKSALLYNVAQSYRLAGDAEKALQFYRSFLRENPSSPQSADARGFVAKLSRLVAKKSRAPAPSAAPGREAPASREVPRSGQAPSAPTPARAGGEPPASAVPAGQPPVAEIPAQPVASAAASPSAAQGPPASPLARVAAPETSVPAHPGGAVPGAALERTSPAPRPGASLRPWAYALAGTSVALLGSGFVFARRAGNADGELQARPHPTAEVEALQSRSRSSHTASALLLTTGAAAAAGAGVLYFLPTFGSGASVGVAGRF